MGAVPGGCVCCDHHPEVLIISTDPAHSLGDALAEKLNGRPRQVVPGRPKLEGKGGETKASTWANKNTGRERTSEPWNFWLLKNGILIRVYYNPPHNWVVCHHIYVPPNQGFFIVHMVGLGVRGCWVDRKRCWEKLFGLVASLTFWQKR